MNKSFPHIFLVFLIVFFPLVASAQFGTDIIKTSKGDLAITFLGHGSLLFKIDGKTIYADPSGRGINYATMPKADVVVITHEHGDHFNLNALQALRKNGTVMLMNKNCAAKAGELAADIKVMKNGDVFEEMGVKIEAVPTYNLVHKRDNGDYFHPKGRDNAYVLTLGDKRVFVAGDTENTPEMKALKNIDIAFLPMNLPFTMTPEMVADAVKAFKPKIFYPYHYRGSDTGKLVRLLSKEKDVEIRIRKMYN